MDGNGDTRVLLEWSGLGGWVDVDRLLVCTVYVYTVLYSSLGR